MPICLSEKSSESELLEALGREFPGAGFRQLSLNKDGWENLVAEVDGAWIVRFPKGKTEKIEKERKILGALAGKTSAAIPNVELWGGSFACMGYRKLAGEILSAEKFGRMSTPQVDQLGEDLARFMVECQQGLNQSGWTKLGLSSQGSRPDLGQIESGLASLGEAQTMQRYRAAAKLVSELEAKAPQGFVHGDLHGGNYLVHGASLRLTAVFDFGDADFGDVHRDFINLSSRPFLCQAAAAAYQRLSGNKLDPQLLKAQAWLYYLWMLAPVALQPESFQHKLARQRLATLETST